MWRLMILAFALTPRTAYAACEKFQFCYNDIGEAVALVYTTAVEVVGLAVFIMFVMAGLSYIIPDKMKSAIPLLSNPMKMIQDAVIGALIVLAAVIILSAINPDLVKKAPASPPTAVPATSQTQATTGTTESNNTPGFEAGGGQSGGGGATGSW